MINAAKRKVLRFLENKGYQLLKTAELNDKIDYYRRVLIESKRSSKEKKIDSIVFSKDRAMQLHAFLKSYIEMVSGRGTTYVFYKASNFRHASSYNELKEIFRSDNIFFVEENDFRKQLIGLCERSPAVSISLYVDDMVFLHKVAYEQILDIDTLENVVSLGRGQDLGYSMVLGKKQLLPEFIKKPDGFVYFRWDYSNDYNDWTYPIGVGGYFFGRDELLVMLKGIEFKAPNSLENNLQKYKPMFIHRFGVCKDQVSCIPVHANLVQTESINPDLGTFSIEDLLKKWEEGLMINLEKFYGISGAMAQFQAYEFTKR
jgi:hypothetical protein